MNTVSMLRRLSFRSCRLALALTATVALSAGCSAAYYATMEKFGVEKREIMVDRVQEGRESQAEAKTEILSALEAFKKVAKFDGGDLEATYSKLNDHYEASADAVDDVKSNIKSIEDVSEALFTEWKGEIDGMHDADLRAKSEGLLSDTKARYATLIAAMKKAEAKMEPVLTAFHDHVTFLKHNLNAKAIASLQDQVVKIEANVGALVADMEKSIAEADAFLKSMDANGK